jgi:hypothetical protein
MRRCLLVLCSLLFVGCETPYNKDDLALNIEAYSKDGECRLVIEGIDTDHKVAEKDIPIIIDTLKKGATP